MPPVYSASAHLSLPASETRSLSAGSYDAGITPHCVSDTTDVLLPSHHLLHDAHRKRPSRIRRIPAVQKPSDHDVLQLLRVFLPLLL